MKTTTACPRPPLHLSVVKHREKAVAFAASFVQSTELREDDSGQEFIESSAGRVGLRQHTANPLGEPGIEDREQGKPPLANSLSPGVMRLDRMQTGIKKADATVGMESRYSQTL